MRVKIIVLYNRMRDEDYQPGQILYLIGHLGIRIASVGRPKELSPAQCEVEIEGELIFKRT